MLQKVFVIRSEQPPVAEVKPLKRVAIKRNLEKLGGIIPKSEWVPLLKKGSGFQIADVEDSERCDVIGDGWRIVVMGCYGQEFTVELFYDYGKGFNSKKITVEYIKLSMLVEAVLWVHNSRKMFIEK